MSYKVVIRPDGNLGIFSDDTDTWVHRELSDEDAAAALSGAEDIDPGVAGKVIRQVRVNRLRKEYSGYVMTWEEAEWRAGGKHGNKPLEWDARGNRIRKHGLSGYARGCRCDVCERREDDGSFTHGLGPTGKPSGYAQGCRCDICREAKATYQRRLTAQRAGTGETMPMSQRGDAMTEYLGARYTAAEIALIERLAEEDDVPVGHWVKAPVLAILEERYEHRNVPRHMVARRPRSGEPPARSQGSDVREVATRERYTRREVELIKLLAAEAGMPVGQWLRERTLARLEERAGYEDMARRKAPRQPNRSREGHPAGG